MFRRRLVFLGMLQLSQQVHQAHLSQRADDRVVSRPEVGNQRAREFLDKELLQRRRPPAPVDHVIGQRGSCEAPQPVRLAVDAPAAFVTVKHGRSQGFLLDLLIPGVKDRLQPIPHSDQAAGRDLHLQMELEHLDNLRERVAQGVVEPGRKHQHAIAQSSLWQSVRHNRLYPLLALRAPVAMDRVFGNFRLDSRDVFRIAGAGIAGPPQSTTAIRALRELVFHFPVDFPGNFAARARVSLFGPGTFLAQFGRWLHPRGRGRGLMRGARRGGLLLGQLFRQFQQREDNGFFALGENRPCLFFSERGPPKNIERRFVQDLRACRHARKS